MYREILPIVFGALIIIANSACTLKATLNETTDTTSNITVRPQAALGGMRMGC
jgi:hypothetical protein